MNTYSILVLDPLGFVDGEVELDFETDEQAVAAIFRADSLFGCELWCGERWLGIFASPRTLKPLN